MQRLNNAEIGVYNALVHNPKHEDCPLILKSGYRSMQYGLYCSVHDTWLKWVSDDDFRHYPAMGIKAVEYSIEIPYRDEDYKGLLEVNYVIVKNFRTGKHVKLWTAFVGNPERDPSLKSYWDLVDEYK